MTTITLSQDLTTDHRQRQGPMEPVAGARDRSAVPQQSALVRRAIALHQRRSAHAAAVAAGVAGIDTHDRSDLNRVQLTGTLGSEPLLYDVGDHLVATLALASARHWCTADGRQQIEQVWFNLSAWEELAAQCGRLLHQGDRVYVEGYLHLWSELRPPQSYACHTVVLDRIVLLAASRPTTAPTSDAGIPTRPTMTNEEETQC